MFDETLALKLANEGYNKSQIAAKLGVSYSTVANNVKVEKKVFKKPCSVNHLRFGAKVSDIMVDKNINVKTLSLRSGIHTTTLSRILRGYQDVRYSEMLRITNALQIDLKDLL